MNRPISRFLTIALAIALIASVGCGKDKAGKNNNNNDNANNKTNSGGTTSNNSTSTNSETNTTGGPTNGGSNTNGGTNTTGETNTNGTTTTNPGVITVNVQVTPNQGPVGTLVNFLFTELSNFTLDPDNIGGAHVEGFGHYHVYIETVDDDHHLLESGMSPTQFNLQPPNAAITPGANFLIVKVHKNDHTEYQNPIEFTVPFTILP